MKDYEKIKNVVTDEKFKFEKGKIFIKDMFDDWSERKPNSVGQVSIFNGTFSYDDVVLVAKGAYEGSAEFRMIRDELTQFPKPEPIVKVKEFKNEEKGVTLHVHNIEAFAPRKERHKELIEKGKEKYNPIGSAEIKTIRKMLGDGKSINKIAETLNAKRTTISYLVGKIKRGEKLKKEK